MTTPNVVAAVLSGMQADGHPAVTELPEAASRPIVRISEGGGGSASSAAPGHIVTQALELHVWGDTKTEAWNAAAAARDWLLAAPRNAPVHAGVTFNLITVTSPSWIPDSDWPSPDGRPGPRYLMYARVTAHT